MSAIEIILGLVAALALVLHFIPKPANPLIAKAQSDVDDLWDKVLELVKGGSGGTTVNNNHTISTPASTAAPVDPLAEGSVNGYLVPSGMTNASFTQLVLAKQGVTGFLKDAVMNAAVASASDAWFAGLGAYFLEQLQYLTVAGTPVGDRVRAYIASAHPVIESVTSQQEAVAAQAAGTAK